MDSTAPNNRPPISRLSDLGGPGGRTFALTFDDGPEEPWTSAVLDALDSVGVPATFFVLGSRIEGNERILRRIADSGHGIEVHAWQHIPMIEQQPAQVADDIRRTSRLICDVAGQRPRFVRPPYGAASVSVLEQIHLSGMTPAFWSTQGWDWKCPGVDAIVRDVSEGLDPGAVVLLHDGDGDGDGDRSQTVEAIPRIVRIATDRGLRAVRLTAAR